MNSNLDLDLLASIASGGLGHWIDDDNGSPKYLKDEDCIACLKDLQTFFRFDDPEERPAFFAVSHYNFARSDLVPLVVSYPDDYEVVYNSLKVCTFLTMTSPDTAPRLLTQEAEKIQQVCEAFLAQDAIAVIVSLLAEPLSRHPKMTDKDTALVELVISFIKNLLSATIPPPGSSNSTLESGKRIRNGLIDCFINNDVLDLLLLVAQHARERPFRSQANVLLDIFLNIFYGRSPQELLGADSALETLEAARQSHRIKSAAVPNAGGRRKRIPLPRHQGLSSLASAPALPLPGIGKSVTRFGPARQQFAGAVYIRRHMDHSAHTVLRHNPHRQELPGILAATNPKQARAQKKDALIGIDTSNGAINSATQRTMAPTSRGPNGSTMHAGAAMVNPHGPVPQSTGRVLTSTGHLGIKEAQLLSQLNTFLSRFLDEAYTPLVGQVFKDIRPGLGVSHLEEEDFERYVRFVTMCTQYVRMKEEAALTSRMQKEKEMNVGHILSTPMSPSGTTTTITAATKNRDNNNGNDVNDRAHDLNDSAHDKEEERSPFECISATMGWDSFHFVQVVFLNAAESEARKAREKTATKRLERFVLFWSLAPLLREMLLTLDLARVAGNTADRKAAERLQKRIMHDEGKDSGLLPVLVRLIREYKYQHQPRSHAVNLIEVLHIVLGTLDRLRVDPSGFTVQQKVRPSSKGKKKEKKKKNEKNTKLSPVVAATADGMLVGGLGETVKGTGNENPQEGEETRQGEEGEGALLHSTLNAASPAADIAGQLHTATTTAEEEEEENGAKDGSLATGVALHPSVEQQQEEQEEEEGNNDKQGQHQQRKEESDEDEDDETSDDEDDEDGLHNKQQPKYREVDFDLSQRLRQSCANPAMIHFYIWLLQGYRTNSPLTNHTIISFLDRIALPAPQGLGLESMLWQLSILRLFHAILSDPFVRSKGEYSQVLRFCIRVTRNVFARLVPNTSEIEQRIEELQRKKERVEDEALIAAAQEIDDHGIDGDAPTTNEEENTTTNINDESPPLLDSNNNDINENTNDNTNENENITDDTPGPALSPTIPSTEHSLEHIEKEIQLANVELKMKQGCASLGFIELLFWKGANVAEVMNEEYNWKKLVNSQSSNNDHDSMAPRQGEGQLGFASYKQPKSSKNHLDFSQDQTDELIDAFERCNGKKDCLDILVFEFAGRFKKNQISRKLKELGLARGKFTRRQEDQLRSLWNIHEDKGPKYKFLAIADDIGAGFTSTKVKRQLVHMGIIDIQRRRGGGGVGKSKYGASNGGGGDANAAWDELFGSEDDVSDPENGGGPRAGVHDNNDDDENSSDDDDNHDNGEVERKNTRENAHDIPSARDSPPEPSSMDLDFIPTTAHNNTNSLVDGNTDGESDQKHKRNAAAASLPAGPTAEQRAKVLELLRMRRSGGAVQKGDGGVDATTMADVHAASGDDVDDAPLVSNGQRKEEKKSVDADNNDEEEVGGDENARQENQQEEEQQQQASSFKTFGRRLKKFGAKKSSIEAVPLADLVDDLFDDV